MTTFALLFSLLFLFIVDANKSAEAAKFFCSSGDVTCLIAAINEANGNPGKHVIELEPGIYTIQAATEGFNALPIIRRSIQIKATTDTAPTVIERDPDALPFRIFQVAPGGELVLDGVTIQRGTGAIAFVPFGAAILNAGTTSLRDSIVTNNIGEGGAIHNSGTLNVFASIITDNFGGHFGGAISNGLPGETAGNVLIENSTISQNASAAGGGILNSEGSLVVRNSAIIFNTTDPFGGGWGNC
jgi:hypothetical protein